MSSNLDSRTLKTRRFLVLEDVDTDFDFERRFLCDLCRDCESVKTIQIVRLRSRPPHPYRDVALRENPGRRDEAAVLTAPLAICAMDAQYHVYRREASEWEGGVPEALPSNPMLVVPWQTTAYSPANFFMPHAVLLDIYTDGSSNTFTATKNLLRGASYPSDLVWVLSGKGGKNETYGVFFPKVEILSEPQQEEARKELLQRLGRTFWEHARRHEQKGKGSVASYLTNRAEEFYEKFVVGESWRRISIERSDLATDEDRALRDVWCGEAADGETFRWAVVRTPQREEAGVFNFFLEALEGENQWRYATGQLFGLPFELLFSATRVRAPETVIEEAARQFTNPQTSFVCRRNLAVFLYLVLAPMANFDRLNAAIPGLNLSGGNFHSIVNQVLGDELTKTHAVISALRRNALRGQPFLDWVKAQFLRRG